MPCYTYTVYTASYFLLNVNMETTNIIITVDNMLSKCFQTEQNYALSIFKSNKYNDIFQF